MRWWKVNIFLVIGVLLAMPACAPVPNMGGEGQPCNNAGSCLPGLVCDTSQSPQICVKPGNLDGGVDAGPDASTDAATDAAIDASNDAATDASTDSGDASSDGSYDAADGGTDAQTDAGPDGSADAGDSGPDAGDAGQDVGIPDVGTTPYIESVDGTGTQKIVTPRPEDEHYLTDYPDHKLAGERISSGEKAVVVSGYNLGAISKVELKGQGEQGDHEMTIASKTSRSLRLLIPGTLTVGGLFIMALTGAAGDANAQVFFLQGQDGTSTTCVVESPGANCPNGGQKCTSATGTSYICNGSKGDNGISVTGQSVGPGLDCTNGGVKYTSVSGIDFVCKGDTGSKGDTGNTGSNGVSVTGVPEGAGGNCTYGGVKYTSASGPNYVCKGDKGDKGDQGDTIFVNQSGTYTATVPVKVSNTFTANSVASTGTISATGQVSGASASITGNVSAGSVTSTGNISTSSGTVSGSTVSGSTVTATSTLNPPTNLTATNLTVSGNLNSTGNLTVANLNVTGTYNLPDCPEGYALASSPAGVTLCKKGNDEMVKVGDFWIDKYEAVVTDDSGWVGGNCSALVQMETSPYTTNTYGARTDNWDLVGDLDATTGRTKFTGTASIPIYACSTKGFLSSRYLTWFQAQEACSASGKELCSNEQWQAAAAGTLDPGANPGSGGSPTANTKCVTDASGPRKTGLAGTVPGGNTSCMSKYGAEDMIGNLYEWVSMWGQGGPDNGVTNGQYKGGNDTTGFSGFSPETSGNADGTWNIAGAAYGCDRAGGSCNWHTGLPFAALRGGTWYVGPEAGAFNLHLHYGPSSRHYNAGLRCCRER